VLVRRTDLELLIAAPELHVSSSSSRHAVPAPRAGGGSVILP
jgi:hypothetical protein